MRISLVKTSFNLRILLKKFRVSQTSMGLNTKLIDITKVSSELQSVICEQIFMITIVPNKASPFRFIENKISAYRREPRENTCLHTGCPKTLVYI